MKTAALRPAVKTPASGTLGHHLHQLVPDAPGGIAENPRLAVQLHRRAPPLPGLGQQQHWRSLRVFRRQLLSWPQCGHANPSGQHQPERCVMALALVSATFEKFVEAEAFPELERIALHEHAPFQSTGYICSIASQNPLMISGN